MLVKCNKIVSEAALRAVLNAFIAVIFRREGGREEVKLCSCFVWRILSNWNPGGTRGARFSPRGLGIAGPRM